MGVPLRAGARARGLTLGHFPSSILCSTVGGWVAARSAGQCSGAYGKIEDMVASLECVTGAGEVVALRRRRERARSGAAGRRQRGDARRRHERDAAPPPGARGAAAFGAWSFPTTRDGWEAMREMFQAGLRPAVARLYDPFDAMLAQQGGVKRRDGAPRGAARGAPGSAACAARACSRRPGGPQRAARLARGRARAGRRDAGRHLRGDATRAPQRGLERARAAREPMGGRVGRRGAARRWLAHRYAVSYRQAPVFATARFVDTMEVAARWSRLGALYEGVRRALGEHVFVMAHFSHAYPDGCCIYFSFAGSADPGLVREPGWDAACAADLRPRLAGRPRRGGRGRGHALPPPRRRPLQGAAHAGRARPGVDVVRALMRAFDPAGILNPGNLLPPPSSAPAPAPAPAPTASSAPLRLDRVSLLACIEGATDLAAAERQLRTTASRSTCGLPRRLPGRLARLGRPRARAIAGSIRPTSSSPGSTRR